jgi:uncharacterized Tic20 family protein
MPPPGAYPPPGGAPYGGGYGAPAGAYGGSDEKTWVLVSHFGGAGAAFLTSAIFGWVVPLIAMMSKGNESPLVKAHAVEALNFQITWAIAAAISWVLLFCSLGLLFFLPLTVVAISVIFGIIAGVKASNGQPYRYPMSIKIIK